MRRALSILFTGLLSAGCASSHDHRHYNGEGLGSDGVVADGYYYDDPRPYDAYVDGPYYRSGVYSHYYYGGRPYYYPSRDRDDRDHDDRDHSDHERDRGRDRNNDSRDDNHRDRNTDDRVRDRDQQHNSQDAARPRSSDSDDRSDSSRSDNRSPVRPGPHGANLDRDAESGRSSRR